MTRGGPPGKRAGGADRLVVGMLLGGASPVQAGAVQVLVLVLLLAVETVAVALMLELVCRGLILRPVTAAA